MSSDECVLKERYKGTTQQESQAKGARKSGTFGRLRSSTHRASRLDTENCGRSRSGNDGWTLYANRNEALKEGDEDKERRRKNQDQQFLSVYHMQGTLHS